MSEVTTTLVKMNDGLSGMFTSLQAVQNKMESAMQGDTPQVTNPRPPDVTGNGVS
jgi:hypothetical protein